MSLSKPKHPYHIIALSPWPIATSFSLLGVAIGALLLLHRMNFAMPIFLGTLLLLLSCMALWWRDVVREARQDKAHTSAVQAGLRLGMALFILSEIAFFGAFFWGFFRYRFYPMDILQDVWPQQAGTWPPAGIVTFDPWDLPFMNTLILLLSGCTVSWAHFAVMDGNQKETVQALACTVGLGFFFSFLQLLEYYHAPFGFTEGIYASNFYMATGFHGAHVFIGTLFLAVCLFRARKGHFTPQSHLGFEFAAWYWHFVDVVWLFLFVFVYIAGR